MNYQDRNHEENQNNIIFKSTKYVVLLQFCQRLVTFALNQLLILLLVSPDLLGRAAIPMELLLSSLLFISREGIRMGVLRENIINKDDLQSVVNLSWFPSVLIGTFSVLFLLFKSLQWVNNNSNSNLFSIIYSDQSDSIVISTYCFAAFLESLAEPFYNVYQNHLNISARIFAEALGIFFKSVVAFVLVGFFKIGINGFALAQVSYGLIYLISMMSNLWFTENIQIKKLVLGNFIPKKLSNGAYIQSELFKYSVSSTISSVFKHVLTEADKIILSVAFSHHDQGIYALTNNYGSLVARLIFLPIEDSSRLAFTKITADLKQNVIIINDKAGDNSEIMKVRVDNLIKLRLLFIRLMSLVSVIGIFFPLFGFPYAQIIVQILLSRWNNPETVTMFQCYFWYVFVLGINGISESFIQTTGFFGVAIILIVIISHLSKEDRKNMLSLFIDTRKRKDLKME
eukprot:gene12926-17324_t